jgi:hypothetical protein
MPIGGYKLIIKKTLMFKHNHLKLWDCPSTKKICETNVVHVNVNGHVTQHAKSCKCKLFTLIAPKFLHLQFLLDIFWGLHLHGMHAQIFEIHLNDPMCIFLVV